MNDVRTAESAAAALAGKHALVTGGTRGIGAADRADAARARRARHDVQAATQLRRRKSRSEMHDDSAQSATCRADVTDPRVREAGIRYRPSPGAVRDIRFW